MHLLISDVQWSMTYLTKPLISHNEMLVPLPASAKLWKASSAEDWAQIFSTEEMSRNRNQTSLRDCVENVGQVLHLSGSVDYTFTSLVMLSSLWAQVLYYRERVSAALLQDHKDKRRSTVIISSLHEDIRESLDNFNTVFADRGSCADPAVQMLHARLSMHLYASLEDIQYFGGKAGETEARRVLNLLKQWSGSRDSRHAVWHAGQVLRVAKRQSQRCPEPAMATAVYHASLVLWAYLIARSSKQGPGTCDKTSVSGTCDIADETAIIEIDGEEDNSVRSFLAFGIGDPVVSLRCVGGRQNAAGFLSCRDGEKLMSAVIDFMCACCTRPQSSISSIMTATLGRLLRALRPAAQIVGSFSSQNFQ